MEFMEFSSMLIQTNICKMTFMRWSGNFNIGWVIKDVKDLLLFAFGMIEALQF